MLHATEAGDRWLAAAAWLGTVAPGVLVTRAIIVLAIETGGPVTDAFSVAPVVRLIAALMLALHAFTALLIWWRATALSAVSFWAACAIEAVLCGVALAQPHLLLPVGLVVAGLLIVNFVGGGWAASAGTVVCVAVTALALWGRVPTGTVIAPVLAFPTALSVETSFGDLRIAASAAPLSSMLGAESPHAAAAPHAFTPSLSPDPFFAGAPSNVPAGRLTSLAAAMMGVALCIGLGLSVLQIQKTKADLATEIVSSGLRR